MVAYGALKGVSKSDILISEDFQPVHAYGVENCTLTPITANKLRITQKRSRFEVTLSESMQDEELESLLSSHE